MALGTPCGRGCFLSARRFYERLEVSGENKDLTVVGVDKYLQLLLYGRVKLSQDLLHVYWADHLHFIRSDDCW